MPMSIPIDPANPNLIQRPVTGYPVLSGGEEEQTALGRPLNGVRRVEPAAGSEKGQATEDSRLRDGRREQHREAFSSGADAEVPTKVAGSGYDRKLTYEADVNRVFLEIVSKTDDEVLIRIPSESTAKYLEQITVRSEETEESKSAPRVFEIV
jgi:hypothetical protein